MSKSEKRRKSAMVMVRVTPETHALLREKALDVGLSVPAYLVTCGLGKQTRTKTDAHVLNELRRLGDLQKQLCREHDGALSPEYTAVLVEILSAMGRIGS